MSVDVIGPEGPILRDGRFRPRPLTGRERMPITDLIVIFSGWGGALRGGQSLETIKEEQKTPGDTDPASLYKRVKKLDPNPGRDLRVVGYLGTLMAAVPEPLQVFREIFHPSMKLIIYGYSAGGGDAIGFARDIWVRHGYYHFEERQHLPASIRPYHHGQISEKIGATRVDLLVTIDPFNGPGTSNVSRDIPLSVRWNWNYYQTHHASDSGAFGAPNYTVNKEATEVKNENDTHKYPPTPPNPRMRRGLKLEDEGHYAIRRDREDKALELIMEELRRTDR